MAPNMNSRWRGVYLVEPEDTLPPRDGPGDGCDGGCDGGCDDCCDDGCERIDGRCCDMIAKLLTIIAVD